MQCPKFVPNKGCPLDKGLPIQAIIWNVVPLVLATVILFIAFWTSNEFETIEDQCGVCYDRPMERYKPCLTPLLARARTYALIVFLSELATSLFWITIAILAILTLDCGCVAFSIGWISYVRDVVALVCMIMWWALKENGGNFGLGYHEFCNPGTRHNATFTEGCSDACPYRFDQEYWGVYRSVELDQLVRGRMNLVYAAIGSLLCNLFGFGIARSVVTNFVYRKVGDDSVQPSEAEMPKIDAATT